MRHFAGCFCEQLEKVRLATTSLLSVSRYRMFGGCDGECYAQELEGGKEV